MTSLVVGLRRNSKALAKAKLAPKNVTVIVWWSATSLSHYSFLNHGENITSEKYAQQMRCTENCNACSQHWSTERAQFFSIMTSTPSRTKLQNLTNRVMKFGFICCIHLTSREWATSISTIFWQGKCFHNQQESENAFQGFVKSRSTDFYATGISKLILVGKSEMIVMVPI